MKMNKTIFLSLLIILFLSAIVIGASLGKWKEVGIKDVSYLLLNKITSSDYSIPIEKEKIIMFYRIPRVLMGILVGFALALSGVIFQAVLKNPLADPFTLGVSSGGALGAAIAIFFDIIFTIGGFSSIPLFAFSGALISLIIVTSISSFKGKYNILVLILSGVVATSFFSACIGFIKYLSDDSLSSIVYWLMGRLDMSGDVYLNIIFMGIVCTIVIITALIYNKELDILTLGDEEAMQLGVNIYFTRYLLLTIASLAAAVCVSFCGIIGFVGLVVPHVVRTFTGPRHKILLIASSLLGSIVLVSADIFTRILPGDSEIPIGIITSLIGAPFFCFILVKKKKDIIGGLS